MPEEGVIKYNYTVKRTSANLVLDDGTVTQNPNVIVTVNNNLGWPVYERSFPYSPENGYDEQGVLKLVKQQFNQNPPLIEAPSSLIYSVDPDNGEILIDQDWEGQTYPKESDIVEFVSDEESIDYEFECTVVDKTTREPLSNVQVVDPNGDKALTNKKGFFKIEGEFMPGEDFQLIFKKSGNDPSYETLNIPITTQAGSIRSNLNIIELSPSSENVDEEIYKAQSISEEEKERLSKEDIADFISVIANKIEDTISKRLVPFMIKKLLCEPFGICDPITTLKKAKELKEKAEKTLEKRKQEKEEKEFNKQVAKGLESGMTQESEGLNVNKPDNIVNDFTFNPSQTNILDFTRENPDEIPTTEDNDDDIPTKRIKKTKIKKYKYPKTKTKPHYLKGGKFFKSNKTARRHRRNPIGGRRR